MILPAIQWNRLYCLWHKDGAGTGKFQPLLDPSSNFQGHSLRFQVSDSIQGQQ